MKQIEEKKKGKTIRFAIVTSKKPKMATMLEAICK
jgi:hypothetical protein